MEVSRRGLLLGGLGVVALGAGSAAAASMITSGAPQQPPASPSNSASGASPSPSANTPADLDLHVWDTVRRPLSKNDDATLTLLDGALPAGLSSRAPLSRGG